MPLPNRSTSSSTLVCSRVGSTSFQSPFRAEPSESPHDLEIVDIDVIQVTSFALVERVLARRDQPTLWVNPRAYILFLDWDGSSPLNAALDAELVVNLCGGTPGKSFNLEVEVVDPAGETQAVESAGAIWPSERTMQVAVDLRKHRLLFQQHGLYRFRLNCDGAVAATLAIPVYGLEAAAEPQLS